MSETSAIVESEKKTESQKPKRNFKINVENIKAKDDSYFVEKIGDEYVVVTKKKENPPLDNESDTRRRSLHLSPHYFEEMKNVDNHTNEDANDPFAKLEFSNDNIKNEQIIRQSELLWKSLLSKQPLIGKEILFELIKDYASHNENAKNAIVFDKDFMCFHSPRDIKDDNNDHKNEKKDKEEVAIQNENIDLKNESELKGKFLTFWLSSIISRANEPHFIYSQLIKIENVGINEKNFDEFIQIINQRVQQSNDLSYTKQQLESLNDVLSRIQLLITLPTCQKCHHKMEREIPRDIKPCKTPNIYGVFFSKMTRSDIVPFCKACQKSLENSDLAFVCPTCGYFGVLRIIRNGKLKGVLMTKGYSLCLDCVWNKDNVNKDLSDESDNENQTNENQTNENHDTIHNENGNDKNVSQ